MRLRVNRASIVVLSWNEPYRILLDDGNWVDVTALDANHCPGSAMLLFTRRDGTRYLHSGDMRYHPRMMDFPRLQNANIETLYLDTTYCSPKHVFPKQDDMIDWIASKVASLWAEPNTMFLIGTYTIGKERILLEVARRCKALLGVTAQKMKTLQKLELDCSIEETFIVSKDPQLVRIVVVSMGELQYNRVNELQKYAIDDDTKLYCFRPSGWSFTKNTNVQSLKPSVYGNVSIYGVPYSEHSSFSELEEFVQFLRPKRLIPTVNCDDEQNVRKMIGLLDRYTEHSTNKSKISFYFDASEDKKQTTQKKSSTTIIQTRTKKQKTSIMQYLVPK